MRAVRDPLLVLTVGVAAVVLALIGFDLRALQSIPATADTVVAINGRAPDMAFGIPDPAQRIGLSEATLAMPGTWQSESRVARRTPVLAVLHEPAPSLRASRTGDDRRVFLLNMARAAREHTSLGIHVDPPGAPWLDDQAKGDR